MEMVILVDEQDRATGTACKLTAHQQALLHRAFSVFVFNNHGELMLQRRSLDKYHSPGLWTNTCCSHPRPGEGTLVAAHRRLQEEMGFDCELQPRFSFIYKASLDNGLTENEFDHVFRGVYHLPPVVNPAEVHAWKWIGVQELVADINTHPERYTVWFRIILQEYLSQLEK